MNEIYAPPHRILVIFSLFNFSSCMNIIGPEILQMNDIVMIEPSTNVGDLDHGDSCINSGGTDITEDVCFHSHPLLQCIGGQCECVFVRHSETRVEQMIFQEGRCKRLEHWECNSTHDCANGLTCQEVKSYPTVVNVNSGSRLYLEQEHDERTPRLPNYFRERVEKILHVKFNKSSSHNKNIENKKIQSNSLRSNNVLGSLKLGDNVHLKKLCINSGKMSFFPQKVTFASIIFKISWMLIVFIL